IRMDAGTERPDLRDPEDFVHQNLLSEATRERGRLLAAILTIARAWIQAGRPSPTRAPLMGPFVEFCRQVFGMLEFAGATNGLGNLDSFRAEQDDEHLEWCVCLEAWHTMAGDHTTTSRELVAIYLDTGSQPAWIGQVSSSLATAFREALPAFLEPSTDAQRGRLNQKLGYALRIRAGRIFGTLRIVRGSAANHAKAVQWQVEEVAQPQSRRARAHTGAREGPANITRI